MNCCPSVGAGVRAGGPRAYMPYAPIAPIDPLDRDPWDTSVTGEAPATLMPFDTQAQDFASEPDYGGDRFEQPTRMSAAREFRQITGPALPYPQAPGSSAPLPEPAAMYDSSPAVMLEPEMRAAAQQMVAAFDRDGDGELSLESEAPPQLAALFGPSSASGRNVTSLELARTLSAYGASRNR